MDRCIGKKLMDKKVFGVGYGRFPREIRNYLAKLRSRSPESDFKISEYIDHPHNEMLLWVSEGGVAPLIGFIILIYIKIEKYSDISMLAQLKIIT